MRLCPGCVIYTVDYFQERDNDGPEDLMPYLQNFSTSLVPRNGKGVIQHNSRDRSIQPGAHTAPHLTRALWYLKQQLTAQTFHPCSHRHICLSASTQVLRPDSGP